MSSFLISGILVSLIFSFFFSTIERVYSAANKLELELEGRLGRFSGKVMTFFIRHTSWFLGTTFIGATVSLVALCTFAALWLVPILQASLPENLNNEIFIIVIQTAFSTLLFLIAAALLPRMALRSGPKQLLSLLILPFAVCFALLFVLVYPVVSIAELIMGRMYQNKVAGQNPLLGFPELNPRFRELSDLKSETEVDPINKKIFRKAIEFKNVKVRDCMIPRTEITAVEIGESVETLRKAFTESGHTKVIIYNKTIDEIIGYCHSSALFKKPERIKDILTPIVIVAETTLASEVMIRFLNERKSLAVVVDEFGGTSGLVSMEDVIEQIFGEIEDEHDEEDGQIEQKLDEHTFLLSARLEIDYLNETYHWELPTGEYETLGGLILSHTEDFPKQGQSISIPPFTFIIQTTGHNRIDTVLAKLDRE
jgi:CBS domain containing-hemolysin-like protein